MSKDPEGREDRTSRNIDIILRHHAGQGSENPSPPGSSPPRQPSWRRWLARLGPIGVALLFLGGKLKLLIPLVKFFKLGSFLSMLLAVWVYATIWGFPFALGFVLLIFVHEMGHAVAMRRMGIPAGAPVFIPFVGAVIAMKGIPRNAWVESVVGIGGPALGTVGAIVCLGIAALTGSKFWYALASTGFLINMFNMIPISPLDGGRIVGVMSRWFWVVGYAIGIVILIKTGSPILFLILLLGLFTLLPTIRGPRPGYYDVHPSGRLVMAVSYFGLLAVMAVGMWLADQPLAGLRADPDTAFLIHRLK